MLNQTTYTELAVIHGGQVLRADETWDDAPLNLSGKHLGGAPAHGKWLDARGCVVLPGIVDFHGDAFERQIMPRPGVRFPLEVALLETDRQLSSNGITTAMHGITYSWEGGLRGRETAAALFDAFDHVQHRLLADHRVHLRFECHNVAGEDDVLEWMNSGRVGLLAFNEHLPGMRHKPRKLQEYADRAGTNIDGFIARLEAAASRTDEVPALIRRLATQAQALGIPMASHDDPTIDVRNAYQQMGCTISEFPLTRAVAEHAVAQGAPVVCGSPNVLRGGSHVGAPGAAELARDGLCNILASDYYYPAPLHAAFALAQSDTLPLARAWRLVSQNPAQALGLTDRGTLTEGLRADVLVVDTRDAGNPHLLATICSGRIVYLADGARLHG